MAGLNNRFELSICKKTTVANAFTWIRDTRAYRYGTTVQRPRSHQLTVKLCVLKPVADLSVHINNSVYSFEYAWTRRPQDTALYPDYITYVVTREVLGFERVCTVLRFG